AGDSAGRTSARCSRGSRPVLARNLAPIKQRAAAIGENETRATATQAADDAAMGVIAMRIMRKIGLRRRQSVKTGHGHMLEPARSAAPCEDHRSGRAARR